MGAADEARPAPAIMFGNAAAAEAAELQEHAMARPDPSPTTGVTRRQVLKQMAGTGAALAWGVTPQVAAASPQDLHHIVLVMMENRSFDHVLGWVPGADEQQAGLTYVDRAGQPQATYPLAPDYQGCGHPDPDHSYDGGRIEYHDGACDGWLRAGANDGYAIGYYMPDDLPLYAGLAQHWLTCDGYFAAIMAPSYPNRIYQYAAQTDRIDQPGRSRRYRRFGTGSPPRGCKAATITLTFPP